MYRSSLTSPENNNIDERKIMKEIYIYMSILIFRLPWHCSLIDVKSHRTDTTISSQLGHVT